MDPLSVGLTLAVVNFALGTASRTLSPIAVDWYRDNYRKEPSGKSLSKFSKNFTELARQNQKLLTLQAEGQKRLAQVYRERNDIEMTRLEMEKAIALAEHQDRQQMLVLQAQLVELKNRELQLTQQLAREEQVFRAQESALYRDLLRELKQKEIDVKLQEIQTQWDAIEKNWPSRLNRRDTEELLLKGREQYPLLLLVAPPNISRSCPDSFQHNLSQELRNHLKLFVEDHFSESDLYPVEFYGDYFNRDIFDIDVKQLKNVLAPLPSVVVYCDVTDREVYFHVGTWGWMDVESVRISSTPWDWKAERKRLEAQGEEPEECFYQLRLQILGMYKVLTAFLADWYYVNLDRNYVPRLLTQPPVGIAQEQLNPLVQLLTAARQHNLARCHYEEGLQLLEFKAPVQAINRFESALQLSTGFTEANLGLGIALYEAGRFKEAEKKLADILTFSPQSALALNYRGLSLLKMGRLEQAISCFEKLVELQPDCQDGLQHLGEAYSALGKVALAKAFWEQAKKLPPCEQKLGPKKPVFPPKPKVGEVFQDKLKDGSLGPEMVVLPAGKFTMGDNEGDSDEKPAHQVTIAYDLAVGKYPVTFDEYDLFCQATKREKPSDSDWGRGRRPVINVYWQDAKDYCQWLSAQTGKTYRLPSEAEWEYAGRAGTNTQYSFGNNENQLQNYAWYDKNSGSKTHPVGEKLPNPWGLYDMHGNVWEWCEDVWHGNYSGAPTDGSAWLTGGEQNNHVLRGGSWYINSHLCRAALRVRYFNRLIINGFRVVGLR